MGNPQSDLVCPGTVGQFRQDPLQSGPLRPRFRVNHRLGYGQEKGAIGPATAQIPDGCQIGVGPPMFHHGEDCLSGSLGRDHRICPLVAGHLLQLS
jgi:hypothetical protein